MELALQKFNTLNLHAATHVAIVLKTNQSKYMMKGGMHHDS